MIVDGRAIAEQMKIDLKQAAAGRNLVLAVVWVGDDPATEKFVNLKKKFGEEIGVEVRVLEYNDSISEAELQVTVKALVDDTDVHGIIVQLPLPPHIKIAQILNLIPATKDVDALTENANVLSPVVGAIKEILDRAKVDLENKKIVILGQGKLVGLPAAIWLAQEGYDPQLLDKNSPDIAATLKTADIIIAGTGRPGLVRPEMIKSGAVLIDAGTSEAEGKIAGDLDPACANVSSIFTPVPGGVGPITVATLFKNLIDLNS